MSPALRFSGLSQRSPSRTSQWIFSHVVTISPSIASTITLPVSRAETLESGVWGGGGRGGGFIGTGMMSTITLPVSQAETLGNNLVRQMDAGVGMLAC